MEAPESENLVITENGGLDEPRMDQIELKKIYMAIQREQIKLVQTNIQQYKKWMEYTKAFELKPTKNDKLGKPLET